MDLFNYKKIGGETLTSAVKLDETLVKLAQATDYTFTGESTFTVPSFDIPPSFSLGVICGSSGTGKSSLLNSFGVIETPTWDASQAVASQVDPDLLMRLGLSSIPSLCRPYHVLSTGEKHRADIARVLRDGAIIDEFTSVCNRELAMSMSVGLRKTIDTLGLKNIVIATPHEDVVQWLEPDWVANTSTGALVEGRSKRPPQEFRLVPCSSDAWRIFAPHHYLSGQLNASARCWLLLSEQGTPCAFASAVAHPFKGVRNAWRGHRVVVHPDFQGLGLSSKIVNAVAQEFIDQGKRYFAKTAHPKLGEYRERSPLWRSTSTNKKSRKKGYEAMLAQQKSGEQAYKGFDYAKHADRLCYSHEYIGQRRARVDASHVASSLKTKVEQPSLF